MSKFHIIDIKYIIAALDQTNNRLKTNFNRLWTLFVFAFSLHFITMSLSIYSVVSYKMIFHYYNIIQYLIYFTFFSFYACLRLGVANHFYESCSAVNFFMLIQSIIAILEICWYQYFNGFENYCLIFAFIAKLLTAMWIVNITIKWRIAFTKFKNYRILKEGIAFKRIS